MDKASLVFQTICLTIVVCVSLCAAEIVMKKTENNSVISNQRQMLATSFIIYCL